MASSKTKMSSAPSTRAPSESSTTSRRSSESSTKTGTTLQGFVKKVRMGKRITNAFTRDKGQASAGSQEQEDDPNKPPEPYLCTGHFQADFTELCKRANMVVVPPVVPRPQRPPSPAPVHVEETKSKPSKAADKKKQAEAPPPDPEPEAELDENGEPPEPPPKTYTTKDKFEYFKPSVQVEMDNPDKQDTVTEVLIKGWKIDTAMMDIFKECWTKMDRLHTINLWHTGLTSESITLLSQFLPECTNVRNLILDNNPVKEENYHLFLKEECPVQNLSLRYNSITDKGAEELGKMLGTTHQQNTKLVTLNLNGNSITDVGAEHLANGLRMNRNLLSLGLANNCISDKGAQKIAEVLSRFPLTHLEIVERRKLFSEKGHPDRKSVSPPPIKSHRRERRKQKEEAAHEEETAETPPPGSRRADSRDRPGSNKSTHGTKGGKSAKNKKADTKGKEDDKAKTKGKDDKAAKKGGQTATSGRNSGASMVNDTKGGGKKGQTKGKGKGGSTQEIESTTPLGNNEASESSELDNPLMDTIERMPNGTIVLSGNRALISLNLSSNQIGEEGLKALALAMGYQSTLASFSGNKPGSTGLMRLCVNRNKVPKDNETLKKLNNLMETKDPYYKPPSSPDAISQASKS